MNLTRITAFGVGLAVVAAALVSTSSVAASVTQSEGIVCEPSSLAATTTTADFDISASTGHISMPDGNVLFSWGYSTGTHNFQLPGPVLCVREGQKVSITLTNTLDEDTSLVFPGQENVMADNVPSMPQVDGSNRVTSLAPVATKSGGQITYSFTATKAGTYLYESGTDPAKQVEMGLYGALIVYPASVTDRATANTAYGDASTAFQPGREFIHILSQVDPALHLAVEQKKPFDWSTYQAHYFLINGRSAPDSVSPNDASWLPNQPYGSMVHVKEQASGGDSAPALVRYINVMPIDAAFHPHGNTETVIAEDGQALKRNGVGNDNSYGSFLVDIGANRTVDALFSWKNVDGYNPDTTSSTFNPIPVQISPYQDVLTTASTWYSMSPYLGHVGDLPAGITSLNQCGEYYHMAHNHALQFATNFGASFGGQMTLIRIDPAAGC